MHVLDSVFCPAAAAAALALPCSLDPLQGQVDPVVLPWLTLSMRTHFGLTSEASPAGNYRRGEVTDPLLHDGGSVLLPH
jgi:hypothetical protein